MFMKTIKSVAAAGVALAALAGPAAAEDREFSWSITLTGTSDYVFRGLSFANEDPAFQPALDMSYGIVYWGVWGSNLGSDDDVFGYWETDYYAGITPTLGPVNLDLGVIFYTYPAGNDSNYVELKAGASIDPVKNVSLGATFFYVPDQDNSVEVYTVEGTASYSFPQVGPLSPSISGLVGYADADDADFFFTGVDSYTYWNVGLGVDISKWSFDFRYWDTDIGNEGTADERFVFTTSISLP